MKVSELSGALLDYWVAKAERIDAQVFGNYCVFQTSDQGAIRVSQTITQTTKSKTGLLGREKVNREEIGWLYSPCQDWAQGGPIIEREAIGSHKGLSSTEGRPWEAWANREGNPDHDICYTGATLLEAAMRCFVASKFGDEVSDELA